MLRLAENDTVSSEPGSHTASMSQRLPSSIAPTTRVLVPHHHDRRGDRSRRHGHANHVTSTVTSSRKRLHSSRETTPDASTDQAASNTFGDLDAITSECIACLGALTIATTPNRRVTEACNHDPSICSDCLAQSIVSQIDSKIWNQIDCPTCKARLSYNDIKAFATEPVFQRYDNLTNLEAMSALPNFRRCLSLGCESGQIHYQGAAQPIMTCHACQRKTCFVHETEWHEGQTCAQVDRQVAKAERRERMANEAYLAANTKACPQESCGRPIEKNGGCSHMTCTQCGHQFCWDCFAPWNEIQRQGNIAHQEICRWHTQNLFPRPANTGAPGDAHIVPDDADLLDEEAAGARDVTAEAWFFQEEDLVDGIQAEDPPQAPVLNPAVVHIIEDDVLTDDGGQHGARAPEAEVMSVVRRQWQPWQRPMLDRGERPGIYDEVESDDEG
ncbi:hypothetical protein MMC26_007428 [Xylographa opegraphella]|nr:hypothetical protein [Xylographa opegraphella]